MRTLITNAFSLNMLQGDATIHVKHIDVDHVRRLVDAWEPTSAVGHDDTAALFSAMLGRQVPVNRVTVELEPGDILIVGQYKGPRLPESCSVLPEGASIVWMLVCIGEPGDE